MKLIIAIASRVSVSRFLDYREYLQAVYEAIKQEIGKYSYLNYSDDLDFLGLEFQELLEQKFALHGIPAVMVSDQIFKIFSLFGLQLEDIRNAYGGLAGQRTTAFDDEMKNVCA